MAVLQEQLQEEIAKHQAAEQETAGWWTACVQLRDDLQKAETAREAAIQENQKICVEFHGLKHELLECKEQAAQISQSEHESRKTAQLQLEQQQQKSTAFKLDRDNKVMELKTMQAKLDKAQEDSRNVDDMQRRMQDLQQETAAVKDQLVLAENTAAAAADLAKQLKECQVRLADLEGRLVTAKRIAEQVSQLQEEKEQTNQRLVDTVKELEDAGERLQCMKVIEAANHRQFDELADLKDQLAVHVGVVEELNALKHESQMKDSQITGLQEHVAKLEAEFRELSQIGSPVPEFLVNDLAFSGSLGRVTDQSSQIKHADIRDTAANGHPGKSDRDGGPRRRAAGRSVQHGETNGRHINQVLDSQEGQTSEESNVLNGPLTAVVGSALRSSDNITRVPDTQAETQLDTQLLIDNSNTATSQQTTPRRNVLATSSDLSELCTAFELDDEEEHHSLADTDDDDDIADDQNNSKLQPSSLKSSLLCKAGHDESPASSYSDDMLLDHGGEAAQGADNGDHNIRHGNLSALATAHTPRRDIEYAHPLQTPARSPPTDFQSRQTAINPSPRRLRSAKQPRERKDTPISHDSQAELSQGATTPMPNSRERHLPNSAAKRRGELEEEVPDSQAQKRLKRNPANLEVRRTNKHTSTPWAGETSDVESSRARSDIPIGVHIGGSIVGTNAPTPGRGQKAVKLVRRGSKQERWSTRFNSKERV